MAAENESAQTPRAVFVLTAAMAAVAVGTAVVDRVSRPHTQIDWPWVVPFVALLVGGGYFVIRFRYRDDTEGLDLSEAILVPVLFAFPGWIVVVMVAVANTIAERLHRDPPVKAVFNVSQWTAAAGCGALVLADLRDGQALTWHNVGALVAAMVVVLVVSHLAVSTVVALAQRLPIGKVLLALRTVIV